jgi:hypothetical protein
MKHAFALVLTAALAAAVSPAGTASAAPAAKKAAAKTTATKVGPIVPPVAVDVVAVDPKAKTITIREITAVPAPAGHPLEITIPVPATATGQKLGDTKAGQQVNITCAIKPTVHPQAGVPVVLTDCVKVMKIEPKS